MEQNQIINTENSYFYFRMPLMSNCNTLFSQNSSIVNSGENDFIIKNIAQEPTFLPNEKSKESNIHMNVNEIKQIELLKKHISRRIMYGKGPENQRLRQSPHFQQPIENTEMYNLLGKPDKIFLNKLGERYNERFHQSIKKKLLPKYGRDQKRSKYLAVWFFEDYKHIIYPWLLSEKII